MTHILRWTKIALEANKIDFSRKPTAIDPNPPGPEQGGPTLSSRALALVHIAMHDAHFGATGFKKGQSFLGIEPDSSSTASDAVSVAAHFVLTRLYPLQKAFFDEALGNTFSRYGENVGQATLNAKFGEVVNPMPYPIRTDRYNHQLDPFASKPELHGEFYGRAKRFAVVNPISLAPPPLPGSKAYDNDAKEVRNKGADPSYRDLTRDPEETMTAQFWAYDGVADIGTPPRLYNQIILSIMEQRGTTNPDDQIRLLTLANVAMGDAGILAWHEKFTHNLWRPVIGLRQHNTSTGPDAVPGNISGDLSDPFWQPLGAPHTNSDKPRFTPPFPAYPSGHATFGAAALQMVRRFYDKKKTREDDKIIFEFVSDEQNGVSKYENNLRTKHVAKFKSCWEAIYLNGASRVFLGVHWRFDAFESENFAQFAKGKGINKIGGVPLGLSIADDIFDGKMKK